MKEKTVSKLLVTFLDVKEIIKILEEIVSFRKECLKIQMDTSYCFMGETENYLSFAIADKHRIIEYKVKNITMSDFGEPASIPLACNINFNTLEAMLIPHLKTVTSTGITFTFDYDRVSKYFNNLTIGGNMYRLFGMTTETPIHTLLQGIKGGITSVSKLDRASISSWLKKPFPEVSQVDGLPFLEYKTPKYTGYLTSKYVEDVLNIIEDKLITFLTKEEFTPAVFVGSKINYWLLPRGKVK